MTSSDTQRGKPATTMQGAVWAFFGDSLTEGIGQARTSYVGELAKLLRGQLDRPVHELRLRRLDLSGHRDLSVFNMAGFVGCDDTASGRPLWILNLAAESTTVEEDAELLKLLSGFNVERVFVLRGPLESVVRPRHIRDGRWPIWVPRSWRPYAALDPRCYFSAGGVRRLKQRTIDASKQWARHRLLQEGGAPLMDDAAFAAAYLSVLASMRAITPDVTVLAMPPVDARTFPGTQAVVDRRNRLIEVMCRDIGCSFFAWDTGTLAGEVGTFCRDGFHPSALGAERMGRQLLGHIKAG